MSSLEYSEDPKDKYYETGIFNDYNTQLFIKDIKNVNWDGVLSCNNPQDSFNCFSNLFMASYDKNFPVSKMKAKNKIDKQKSPWLTKCILKSIRTKNQLYKKFLSYPSKKNENKYKKYKNKLNLNQFENYRPISVLTCFTKILEKLMYKRLIKFVEKNNILTDYQYGFRKNPDQLN